MNNFDYMYVVEFLENGSNRKYKGLGFYPNFKNIFVIDFFVLRDSFLQCSHNDMSDYYENCDHILKSVKIFP